MFLIAATSLIGIFGVAAALEGFLLTEMGIIERVVLIAGGLMMIVPGTMTDIIGLALIAVGIMLQVVKKKQRVKPA